MFEKGKAIKSWTSCNRTRRSFIRENRALLFNNTGFQFGKMKNVLEINGGDAYIIS